MSHCIGGDPINRCSIINRSYRIRLYSGRDRISHATTGINIHSGIQIRIIRKNPSGRSRSHFCCRNRPTRKGWCSSSIGQKSSYRINRIGNIYVGYCRITVIFYINFINNLGDIDGIWR